MRILMCKPTFFDVEYEINAWMHKSNPVDRQAAAKQWEDLHSKYLELGFDIELIEPVEHLPDMVFTANGALVIDGKVALPRFRFPERQPETEHFRKWFESNNFSELLMPDNDFEGEGDALVFGDKILAGWGFRSDRDSHAELSQFFDRKVVSLHLINQHFYHVDTCLAILDNHTLAYFPDAFDEEAQALVHEVAERVIEVNEDDAKAFGLNAMSDGKNVVCSDRATGFHKQLEEAGFNPIPTPISEFQKSGGGVKCMTLSLRD